MRKKWIQDPKTHKLVPASQYCRRPRERKTAHIMPDIKPFTTVCGDIAGQEISSRSQLREFEKRNNLIQVGNDKSYVERPDPKKQEREHRESIKRDLLRARRDLNV